MDSPVMVPKMVFLRLSCSQRSNVIKNWLPLLWGRFSFAQATKPLQACPGRCTLLRRMLDKDQDLSGHARGDAEGKFQWGKRAGSMLSNPA